MARFEIDFPRTAAFRGEMDQPRRRPRPRIDRGRAEDPMRDLYMGAQLVKQLLPQAQTVYALGQAFGLVDEPGAGEKATTTTMTGTQPPPAEAIRQAEMAAAQQAAIQRGAESLARKPSAQGSPHDVDHPTDGAPPQVEQPQPQPYTWQHTEYAADDAVRPTSGEAIAAVRSAIASGDPSAYQQAMQEASRADVADMAPQSYAELFSPHLKRRRFMTEVGRMAGPRAPSAFEQMYKRALIEDRAARLKERQRENTRRELAEQRMGEAQKALEAYRDGKASREETRLAIQEADAAIRQEQAPDKARAIRMRIAQMAESIAASRFKRSPEWQAAALQRAKAIGGIRAAQRGEQRISDKLAALEGKIAGAKARVAENPEFQVFGPKTGDLLEKHGSFGDVRKAKGKADIERKKGAAAAVRFQTEFDKLVEQRNRLRAQLKGK